jgi:hypothetical protein
MFKGYVLADVASLIERESWSRILPPDHFPIGLGLLFLSDKPKRAEEPAQFP